MKTDPKPNLSPAAIQANICYYSAKAAEALREYRQALAQETSWLLQLQELKGSTK